MIRIKQFDHISMAVPALDPQIEMMEGLLGFRLRKQFESDEGYFGAALRIPGRSAIGWELIAPNSPDSYLQRFLDGPTGPGLHHVAVQVESTEQAAEVVGAEGFEPWGAREPDEERPTSVLYLHPRDAGQGFLWQLYAGDAWNDGETFEDERSDTLGIVAVNHLAHATPDRDDLAGWYERVFGCRTIWRSAEDGTARGFNTRVVETPTEQLRFEMIEPAGEHSFISRFLETRGPTMHHLTVEVRDWGQALNACRLRGIEPFGVQSGVTDGASWSEAFIHPRHTGGLLMQFFWQERPGTWI